MSFSRWFICLALAATVVASVQAEAHSPGNLVSLRLRSSSHSKIIVPVTINHTGPYDFLVDTGTSQNYEGFWTPAGGHSAAIGPHDSETVTLYPPAKTAAPKRSAHWLVEAYTSPSSLSTSSLVPFP